jgi:arylsulfatase A-like enzyme
MSRQHLCPLAPPPKKARSRASERFSAANGLALFFGVAAALNAVWIARLPAAPVRVRAAHHFYDAGELLFAGLLTSAAVEAYRKWGARGRAIAYLHVTLVAVALGVWALAEDVSGMADRLTGVLPAKAASLLLCGALALSVPSAMAVGSVLAAPGRRWAGVIAAVGLLTLNANVLQNGYPAIHLFMTLMAVTLGAAALAGAALPIETPRWLGHSARLALAVPAAIAVVSFPSSTVLAELYRLDTAVLAPWVAEFHERDSAEAGSIPVELRYWFEKRVAKTQLPATTPALLPPNPIVILITIDALRGDVVRDDRFNEYSPFLHSLEQSGVYFSNTHSFSSGTRLSLGSLFTSRHYSQLPWLNRKTLRPRLEKGTVPRLPELLSSGGVHTIQMISHSVLTAKTGIALGFNEEKSFARPDDAVHPRASELLAAVAERLTRVDDRSLFIYTHLMDPHAPYKYGGVGKNQFESYLLEVRSVDRELATLVDVLDRLGLKQRTALLIASDHGEAFGEHGELAHDKSLHEVQVDVPLLASVPGASARRVDAPVSLLDVAPTVLDLFGLPIPGELMGASLAPYFRGDHLPSGRPIFMENRSAYALLFADGYKAIIEPTRKREALYHLPTDPGELENLVDLQPEKAARYLEFLRTYRETHSAQ